MTIADPALHPFQAYDLSSNAEWNGIAVNTADDAFFEQKTRELEDAFRAAIERGGLFKFVGRYIRTSREMLRHADNYPLLRNLLKNALFRLVHYYVFIRHRTRPALAVKGSSYIWHLPPALIAKAQAAAAVQERDNATVRDYDLGGDPALKDWVMQNVHPIIQGYVGTKVVKPWAQIRYADAAKHGDGWSYIYKSHPFAYFHLDELLYSIPLIVYLTDVDATTGAFCYVEGTDKLSQNWVLRAFHQAVYHGSNVTCRTEDERKTIASLPGPFRGGDLVGTFTGPAPFEKAEIVRVTGPAGTALISDGFQLVHAGGHPQVGARKALFVAFRYPQKRIADLIARAIAEYWSWRVGSRAGERVR